MKTFTLYILIIITDISFAQNLIELNWTYSDFMENNVKKVSSYSIPLRKNGKVKKRDSILLFSKQIDFESKTIYGIESSLTVVSHDGSYLTWYSFKHQYNENGLLLKESFEPTTIYNKPKNNDSFDDQGEIKYEYDNQNNVVKIEHKNLYGHNSILEFEYNSNNQKIKQYLTLKHNSQIINDFVICSNCISKYISNEWKYNSENRLIEYVSYTREKELHTKSNYYYDLKNRVIKQIDSTGWYIYNKPIWKATITYEYNSNGTIETKISNTDKKINSHFLKEITVYDNNNRVLNQTYYNHLSKDPYKYDYKWEKQVLVEKSYTFFKNSIVTEKFEYNSSNLITEKSKFKNGKRIELERYYYE